jgi:hypothetical protein
MYKSHPLLTMLAFSQNADNAATVSNLIRGMYTTLFMPNDVAYIVKKKQSMVKYYQNTA